MTGWELHPVDKYMSCSLLITEISPVFFSCPPSQHPGGTRKVRMDEYIHTLGFEHIVYHHTYTHIQKGSGINWGTGVLPRGSTSF